MVFSDTFKLEFRSDQEIIDATLFKWGLTEYGTAEGITLPIEKSGNIYTITYVENNVVPLV